RSGRCDRGAFGHPGPEFAPYLDRCFGHDRCRRFTTVACPNTEGAMTRHQVEKYRERLRSLAQRLGATVSGLEDQARTPTGGESSGGLSNAPLHLGDVGSETYNQELGATLLENETYIRGEVLDTLERIDRGTFGQCENCGQIIAPERLDALPY